MFGYVKEGFGWLTLALLATVTIFFKCVNSTVKSIFNESFV